MTFDESLYDWCSLWSASASAVALHYVAAEDVRARVYRRLMPADVRLPALVLWRVGGEHYRTIEGPIDLWQSIYEVRHYGRIRSDAEGGAVAMRDLEGRRAPLADQAPYCGQVMIGPDVDEYDETTGDFYIRQEMTIIHG